jgi:hypothetical protein
MTALETRIASLTKAVEGKDAYLARRAAQKAEAIANAKPIPAGRVDIEGTIISIKSYSLTVGYNTNVTSLKALIQCDGYKLFGTLPASIVDDAKTGDAVRRRQGEGAGLRRLQPSDRRRDSGSRDRLTI